MMPRQEFEQKIVPFYQRLEDSDYGGFFGRVDYELNIYKRTAKNMIQNSRLMWFFSVASSILERGDLMPCAESAFNFLRDCGTDNKHGGVYLVLSHSGSDIEDDTKNALCQATAILGLSAYGTKEALAKAVELYMILESRFFDGSGYRENFNSDYSRCLSVNKHVSTLIHIVEAYTQLWNKTKAVQIKESLERALIILYSVFYKKDTCSLSELVDENGKVVSLRRSFGHEMECSHLVDKAYEALGKDALDWTIELFNSSLRSAMVLNHIAYSENKTEAVHWVQAQAVSAGCNAWKRTSDKKYLDVIKMLYDFIEEKIVMKHSDGEWYYDDTKFAKDIVSTWKGPYNNTYMYLELMSLQAAERVAL